MKKLSLVLVFLVCFGAINGFCFPKKQSAPQQQVSDVQQQTNTPQQKTIEDLIIAIGGQQVEIGAQQQTITTQLKEIGSQQIEIGVQQQTISSQLTEIANQLKEIDNQVLPTLTSLSNQTVVPSQTGLSNQAGPSNQIVTPNQPALPDQSVSSNQTLAANQILVADQLNDNSQERFVPITREIINAVISNRQSLYNLGYYLSIPLTLVANNQKTTGIINEAGAFILNEVNTSSELKILTEEKGRLENYSAGGREFFEVSFFWTEPGKTIRLTFERNEQKNSYDLVSANDDRKKYVLSTNKDEPIPQLFIKYNYNISNQDNIVKVQGLTVAHPTEKEGRIENPQLQQGGSRITVPAPPPSPPMEIINARNVSIEGTGSLDRNDIVRYIKEYNPNPPQNVDALIKAYIDEAKVESINWDIAIAQMCYATNYLKDRQLLNTHNYAGFAAINRVPVSYRSMNDGVRAHIQHLKGYATHVLPKGNIVDQRYYILGDILGTVKTLDALFKTWAPANYQNYGNRINGILRGLYGT